MATVPLMFAQEDVEFGGKPGIINDFAYNNNVMQATMNVRLGRCIYLLILLFSHILNDVNQ
jgi:type III secretory pathway component EscT